MTKALYVGIAVYMVVAVTAILLLVLPDTSSAPPPPDQTVTYKDLVRVDPPVVRASTLTVTGEARGRWYFEASFPVELRDAAGNTLGEVPAQAQGEWMTEDYVPFSATLTYPAQPASSTGTLILKKDNPSGLPEHDDSVSIPVVF